MATPDSNIPLHQPLNVLFEQLKSAEPRERYEAVCALGRYPVHDSFFDTWDKVWALTEDLDRRVQRAAGIAGSMISARNRAVFDKHALLYGHPIPDFLKTWDEINLRCLPPPTLDDGNTNDEPR